MTTELAGKEKKQKKAKKQKPVKEPKTLLSPTNQEVVNYRVYYMKTWEMIAYFVLAFAAGAAVGLIFYSGIGKDSYGNATSLTIICNTGIALVGGLVAARIFLPMRNQQLLDKRKRELTLQFRELMDSLATSLGTGKNVLDSFLTAQEDLAVQYAQDSYIIMEVSNIISGLNNNVEIETLLADFGQRSGISDIRDFASVFETCYRKGGNLKDVVRHSYDIISDKITITQEIQTKVTSNKTEANVLCVIPIGIVAMIKFSNPDFAAGFVTPLGLVATTVAIGIFIGAFLLSKKILRIEV